MKRYSRYNNSMDTIKEKVDEKAIKDKRKKSTIHQALIDAFGEDCVIDARNPLMDDVIRYNKKLKKEVEQLKQKALNGVYIEEQSKMQLLKYNQYLFEELHKYKQLSEELSQKLQKYESTKEIKKD